MSEREIQNSILLASARDVLLFRSNAGKWFNVPHPCPRCAAQGRWIQGMPTGSPDLIGLIRGSGKALAVEAKSATGRQRPEQANFERAWTQAGGLYVLARSPDDVLSRIKED